MLSRAPDRCPHCGGSLAKGNEGTARLPPDERCDLDQLALVASTESTFDESVRVRASQEDIRKLVAKRRRGTP